MNIMLLLKIKKRLFVVMDSFLHRAKPHLRKKLKESLG